MIAGELAALPTEVEPSETVAQRLAGYLADVGRGWHDATMEERNRLARELFASAIVENRTVVAVEPRPDLLPFFRTVNWCVGGSDGDLLRGCILPPRAQVVAYPMICHRSRISRSGANSGSAARRHDTDRLRVTRAMRAQGRTLREIAAEIGASHETVRTLIIRDRRDTD